MNLEIITRSIISKVGDVLFEVGYATLMVWSSFGLSANVDYLKKVKGGINDRKF